MALSASGSWPGPGAVYGPATAPRTLPTGFCGVGCRAEGRGGWSCSCSGGMLATVARARALRSGRVCWATAPPTLLTPLTQRQCLCAHFTNFAHFAHFTHFTHPKSLYSSSKHLHALLTLHMLFSLYALYTLYALYSLYAMCSMGCPPFQP
jgi:hypothetical protein